MADQARTGSRSEVWDVAVAVIRGGRERADLRLERFYAFRDVARAQSERRADVVANGLPEARRLKRVAREKGGGIGEAYSLACRMEDALGQALREATGEAAAALTQATADFHKMRDEIVRALGAS